MYVRRIFMKSKASSETTSDSTAVHVPGVIDQDLEEDEIITARLDWQV